MRTPIQIALAGALALAVSPAAAQERISYALLLDPSHNALVWAIANGKVKSDKIVVELKSVTIPAMIQALPTKQYDVLETAVPNLPIAIARGIPIKILSTAVRLRAEGVSGDLWVKADGPIKTAADLKGKTIGVYGIQSTGILLTRYVLNKKYGFNVALEGGDLKFAELPAPGIPGAVIAGRIEAGAFLHYQAYQATLGKELRNIGAGQKDMVELLGVPPVTAVNISYADKLAARPEAFKEFNRLLHASYLYMLANKAEVYGAVAREAKAEPGYFDAYFSRYAEFPIAMSAGDVTAIRKTWEMSRDFKMYESFPDVNTVVWEHALRQ